MSHWATDTEVIESSLSVTTLKDQRAVSAEVKRETQVAFDPATVQELTEVDTDFVSISFA